MSNSGADLLRECVEAEYHHRLLIEEYQQERYRIYAGIYPGYNTELGRIEQETISTENAAIYIIDSEKRIKEELKPLQPLRHILEKALMVLSNKELEAFNHLVWNEESTINNDELKQLNIDINRALISYLEKHFLSLPQ